MMTTTIRVKYLARTNVNTNERKSSSSRRRRRRRTILRAWSSIDDSLGGVQIFAEPLEERKSASYRAKAMEADTLKRRTVVSTLLMIGCSLLNGEDVVVGAVRAKERGDAYVVDSEIYQRNGLLRGKILLPPAYHKTNGARSRIRTTQTTSSSNSSDSSSDDNHRTIEILNYGGEELRDELEFSVHYENAEVNDSMSVFALVYFCKDDDVCLSRTVEFRYKVVAADSSSSSSSSSSGAGEGNTKVDDEEKMNDIDGSTVVLYEIPTPEQEMQSSFVVPDFVD